ncbi:hypothetical protein Lal_00026129 [Lupinus albus]|nr:hypothetical protein Lal_00026129 [Lupinus albus]
MFIISHNTINPNYPLILMTPPPFSLLVLNFGCDHNCHYMKYLERKQRCGSNISADKQPLELAKKKNSYKGTLLDRVACLEHRLHKAKI